MMAIRLMNTHQADVNRYRPFPCQVQIRSDLTSLEKVSHGWPVGRQYIHTSKLSLQSSLRSTYEFRRYVPVSSTSLSKPCTPPVHPKYPGCVEKPSVCLHNEDLKLGVR